MSRNITKTWLWAVPVVVVAIAIAFLASSTFQAQSPSIKGRNPLSVKGVAETTWVEQFDVSPDGRQVAFRSARGENYNLWLIPVAGGEPKVLTSHPVGSRARNPRWSPDGQWIAYEVDEHRLYQSETNDVYVVPAGGGEPRNLTNSTWSNESNIVWSPDSRYIAFSSGNRKADRMIPLAGGGIVRVELATGEIKQISPRGGRDLQWSPDGRYIIYTSNRVRTPTFYANSDIYMIPAEGGEERLLTPDTVGFIERDPHWSPDSQKVAFTSDRSGYDAVMVLDVESGQSRALTDTNFDHANPTWSPDGETIAYVVNQEYNYYIETVSPEGGMPTRVTDRPGVNGGMERIQLRGTLHWLPDSGQIVYTHMSPSNTSDLWVIDAQGGTPRRITDSRHVALRDEERFIWPELFKYKSFDGMEVQGFLYKPKGVTDGDRAPFAIFYRANSTGQHPVSWQPYVQYIVSKGYVVFAPNFRGSTGQGKAYADAGRTWGGDRDIKDALFAVDLLAAQELIDPDRMAVWGGSTGGFFVMTTLIQRPRTFKAATVFYGGSGADLSTRAGYFHEQEYGWMGQMIGGTPLTNPKSFYDRSPINFVENFDTPIDFLYAEGDPSARFEQVKQIVPVLEHFNKEYSYKLYMQEPHGWYHWRPVNVEDSLRRLGDFFDDKVLGMGEGASQVDGPS